MANIFENFVNYYDKTANTNDRIARGQYADSADQLRMNNTFSNDAVTRAYNTMISDRYGQQTPYTVNEWRRQDAISAGRHPTLLAEDAAIAQQVKENPDFLSQAAYARLASSTTRAKDEMLRLGTNYDYNAANTQSILGPARNASIYSMDKAQTLAMMGDDPIEMAKHFGSGQFIKTPTGWTKDGAPVSTSANQMHAQEMRTIDEAMRARAAAANATPSAERPFSAKNGLAYDPNKNQLSSPLFQPASQLFGAPGTPGAAVPQSFYGRYPNDPNAVSSNPIGPVGMGPAAYQTEPGVMYPPESMYRGQQTEGFVKNPDFVAGPSGQVGPYNPIFPYEAGSNGMVRKPDAYTRTEQFGNALGEFNGMMSTPGLLSGMGRDDNITKDYVPDKDQELIKEYGALSTGEQVKLGLDAYAKYNAAKRRIAQFKYFAEVNTDNKKISEDRYNEAQRRAEFERRHLGK